MDRTETIRTLLEAVESGAQAAQDADLLVMYLEEPNYQLEIRVRGRLLSIEHEQGLAADALLDVWNLTGLERGMPPVPAP